MKLPNCENAVIAIEKIRDYCLSDEHPVGKHKARIFRMKLGFVSGDAEFLKTRILEAIKKKMS